VNRLHAYSIAYSDLPQGKHEFELLADDAFFQRFERSEIAEGKVGVYVQLEKTSTFMTLLLNMEGSVKVACDRCLDEFFMPVEFEGTLTVFFGGAAGHGNAPEGDDEVMHMMPGDTEVDLAQYIYESICLSLPMQRLHPNDEQGRSTCNQEMMAKLEQLLVNKE
jgi:uncharacterized metal-binding protein YceD (DUF177 family)